MDVLTVVSCVACFFFSLGLLHGGKKKKSLPKLQEKKEYPKQTRISSLDLLGK